MQPGQFTPAMSPAAAPAGYGSMKLASMEPQMQEVPVEYYGGAVSGFHAKKPFVPTPRRRLNYVPMVIAVLLPWILFNLIYWVTSFSLRFDYPVFFYAAFIGCSLMVMFVTIFAIWRRIKYFDMTEREPSWTVFLALTLLLALAMGSYLGDRTYTQYMHPYFDFHNLNAYTDIYPDRMRGQQLMDAGAVKFTEGSSLDIGRSMGFKHGSMYCVAPIVNGNATMKTYDFWAVGMNCCSGSQADFHCSGWNHPHSGGLRLMGGGKEYYRLAVQQAEATYGIKAVHPLFFEWVVQPLDMVESWRSQAMNAFLVWIFAHLCLQTFLVVSAAFFYSKLGVY